MKLRIAPAIKKFALLALLAASPLFAVTTSYYEEAGVRDFEGGLFEGIAIDDNGELCLAPETRAIFEKDEQFIWDLARAKNGDLIASSGSKGNLWRVAADGKQTLIASLGASAAYSVALAADGRIFAAVSGPARIVRIDADGKQTQLAKLENNYIWKLLYGTDGKLYAACGNPATLERIDPSSGKTERLYAAKGDSHLMAMAQDAQGNIYFGSEGNGTLYRRAKDGQVAALFSTYENEISCVTIDPEGRVYFGTASQQRMETDSNFNYDNDSMDIREREQRLEEAREREESESDESKKKKKPLKNSIYRLNRDGSVEKIFTLSDTSFYSLATDDSGALYAGSGDLGVLYQIDAAGRAGRVTRIGDSLILCLIANGSTLYAGSGNDGRVYAIDRAKGLSGTYTSRVLDCRANVSFGAFSWNASVPPKASLTIATRSGNTNPVDESWSAWSAPYTQASGTKITSPRARYVQYRIEMKSAAMDASPRLYSLRIPFVHDNRAPRVRSAALTTYADSKITKKVKLGPGQAALTWQSDDDDGDTLAHTLYFRMNDDPNWRLLNIETQPNQALLNAEVLPDGWYQFRVSASDRPSNPDSLAKTAFADSRRVLLDNTPPVIGMLSAKTIGGKVLITGTVEDAFSSVSMIRYSLNTENWVYIPPRDGIFDSKIESFEIELPLADTAALIDGSNIIFIRACDQQENWSSAQLIFTTRLPEGALGKANTRKYIFSE